MPLSKHPIGGPTAAVLAALLFLPSASADATAQYTLLELIKHGESEWVVEMELLVPARRNAEQLTDVIRFDQGVFFSRRLGLEGYLASELRIRSHKRDGAEWDTMQVKAQEGVAIWTGKIIDGVLEGTLNQYGMSGGSDSRIYAVKGHRLTVETLKDLADHSHVRAHAPQQAGPSWQDTVSLLKERLLQLVLLQNRLHDLEKRQGVLEQQNLALAAAVAEQRALSALAPGEGILAPQGTETAPWEVYDYSIDMAKAALNDLADARERLSSLYEVHKSLNAGFEALQQDIDAMRSAHGVTPLAVLREQDTSPEVDILQSEQVQRLDRLKSEFFRQLSSHTALEEQMKMTKAVLDRRQASITALEMHIERMEKEAKTEGFDVQTAVMLKEKKAALIELRESHTFVAGLLDELRGVLQQIEMSKNQLLQD